MAKAEISINRFRLHFEIPKGTLENWLEKLTIMGADSVGYELITDVNSYKKNGSALARSKNDKTIDEELVEFINTSVYPSFKMGAFEEHCEAVGLMVGNYIRKAALRRAVNGGLLGTAGDMSATRYTILAKQLTHQRAPSEKRPLSAAQKKRTMTYYETTNWSFIADLAKRRSTLKSLDIVKMFRDVGRNPKSISVILSLMRKDGYLESTGQPGVFRVLQKPPAERSQRHAPAANPTVATNEVSHEG